MAVDARGVSDLAPDAAVAAPRAVAPVPAVGGEPAAGGDAAQGHRIAAWRVASGRHRHSQRARPRHRRRAVDWRARHGKPRLAPDARRQGAGAHPRRAAVKAVSRRRGRRVDVARRRADQARRRHRRQGPHLRADQRRAVDVDPEAGFRAPVRRRAERGAVPGAGQAARPQRAGGHHRQGGQAHLSDGEALRPRRAARPLAPPAPGGFLPGARQAAVGEVRDPTRRASPARRWRRCSP